MANDELLRRIDEVLHYEWDPIGVAGVPEARGEYAGYVRGVYELLAAGGDVKRVSDHLKRIEVEDMGIDSAASSSWDSSRVLVGWRDFLAARGPA